VTSELRAGCRAVGHMSPAVLSWLCIQAGRTCLVLGRAAVVHRGCGGTKLPLFLSHLMLQHAMSYGPFDPVSWQKHLVCLLAWYEE
jgi:hypothetical protein